MFYLYHNFVSVKELQIYFQAWIRAQIAKCSWSCASLRPPKFIWNKIHLTSPKHHFAWILPNMSQYFPNHCIFFFPSWIGPDILMNNLEDGIIFLIWEPGFCLIFILSKKKKKGFQPGDLLKMISSLNTEAQKLN